MEKFTFKDALWPDVSQPAKAHYAADQGFWLALLIAGVTAILISMGIFPPWSWVDVGLNAIVAFGLRMRMRSAAVAGLLLFVANRATAIPSEPQQIIYALLFLLVFVNALRGTFSLRSKQQSASLKTGQSTIPRLRRVDFLAFAFILIVFLVPFTLFQENDRRDFIDTIREKAGVEEDSAARTSDEPTIITMAGGSVITLTNDWKIQQASDAPEHSVFAEFRDGNMWVLVQEESKAEIMRTLGDDYVGEITLERYAEAVSNVLTSGLTETTVGALSSVTISGERCLRFAAEGITENVRLHFEPTMCDIGDAFLRATVWSPKSVFETQRATTDKVIAGISW